MKKKTKNALTLNKAIAPLPNIEVVTITINKSLIRNDSMEGRSYIVAPMVMLTEGVHAGSQGPLYYPKEELEKFPGVWNHKPIVVYHPTENGKGVSACDPVIISSRKVGVVMNTKFEDGKLKAEAWLEQTRMDEVDSRISDCIEKGSLMELSTGLFTENEEAEGEWNGESYTAIARNYRPDHLALLPDKKGACSIADGAGLLQNEMSHESLRMQLTTLVRKKLNVSDSNGPWVYVEAVFDSFFVYESENELFKLEYSATDTSVEIEGEPVKVVRVTEYRTTEGNFVGNAFPNQKQNQNNKTVMNKKEIVDNLIVNTGWSEDDRKSLMQKDETELKKMLPVANSNEEEEEEQPKKVPATEASKTEAPVAPAPAQNKQEAPKPVTMEEYISNAPAEMRDVLQNGIDAHNKEKAELIAKITANKANMFTENELKGRKIQDLRGIAALAAVPTAVNNQRRFDYSGQGDPALTENSKPEALALPRMSFTD